MKPHFVFSLFLFPALFLTSVLPAQSFDTSMWVPSNIITQMCEYNNVLYMAGGFAHWGPNRPFAEVVDSVNGIVNAGFPRPNAFVQTTEPDGRGGYFIGGGFNQVGDSLRSCIAHIDNRGHVSAWKADVTGTGVQTLYFDGTNLYVGGQFTMIGGQARNNIAEIDTLGNVLSWNPNSNSTVDHIDKLNNKIYVSGLFSVIGGQTRHYLAQLDATTAQATVWNPNPDTYASNGLKVYCDRVFTAGVFSTIGSATRSGLAALDTITGLALPFNVTHGGGYYIDILPSGDSLLLGGYFNLIDGQSRSHFAVVDTSTGSLRNWQPTFNSQPYKFFISGHTLYVGGSFSLVNNATRNNACAFDLNTGQLTSWNPSCGNSVYDFCQTPSGICITGQFVCINAIDRWQLAAYDLSTHTFSPLQLTPGSIAGGQFHSIAVTSNRVYLSGAFTSINNQTRHGLAAIDIQTGNLLPWNPNPIYSGVADVKKIILKDSLLYVCGLFNTIGGQPRSSLACIDTVTGTPSSWYPTPNNSVQTIFIHDSLIYAGGYFTTINAQSHVRLAALSLATALPTSWNPSISGGGNQINNILLLDTEIIATGFFTTANSQARSNIAAFGISSGALLALNPNLNSGIDFAIMNNSGSALYMCGQFTQVNSVARYKTAAINPYTGNLLSWDIQGDLGGMEFIVDTNKVWVAGFFYTLHNLPHAYFVGVDAVPDTVIVTSIQTTEENSIFNLFPNPSQDKITIQLKNEISDFYDVSVYDVNGRMVMTQHLQEHESILDFSTFNSGIYLLRLNNKDGSVAGTARVVVAR